MLAGGIGVGDGFGHRTSIDSDGVLAIVLKNNDFIVFSFNKVSGRGEPGQLILGGADFEIAIFFQVVNISVIFGDISGLELGIRAGERANEIFRNDGRGGGGVQKLGFFGGKG